MKKYLQNMVHALELLSANSNDQLHYLLEIGLPNEIDELALEFEDEASLITSMFKKGQLSRSQFDALNKLSDKLDQMSGRSNKELWQPSTLRDSPEWKEIRLLAKNALALLSGEEPRE